jgi:hypothetical protein
MSYSQFLSNEPCVREWEGECDRLKSKSYESVSFESANEEERVKDFYANYADQRGLAKGIIEAVEVQGHRSPFFGAKAKRAGKGRNTSATDGTDYTDGKEPGTAFAIRICSLMFGGNYQKGTFWVWGGQSGAAGRWELPARSPALRPSGAAAAPKVFGAMLRIGGFRRLAADNGG